MDDGEDDLRFSSGDELRRAAENRFGRSLSQEEWQSIDHEGWSGRPHSAYGAADLNELLQLMEQLPALPEPTTLDRQRAQALANRQRTAAEAKEFVEKERIRLFGGPQPPFVNDAAAALEWIEAQAGPARIFIFTLSVAMPAELDNIDRFVWLRDWLTDALPNEPSDDPEERKATFRSLMQAETSPIRRIGREAPILDYFEVVAPGEATMKPVRADDGSVLGNLREAADGLAKATRWSQVASVHHILTGGVMSAPVYARAHNRWGRESFGGPAITIEILDPFGVSAEEVAKAYIQARESIFRPTDMPRRRSRASAKHERVAALVEETSELTWEERWTLWNDRYPDQRFSTPEALRQVHRRAHRP